MKHTLFEIEYEYGVTQLVDDVEPKGLSLPLAHATQDATVEPALILYEFAAHS